MTRWADGTLLLVCSRLAHGDEGAPRQPYVEPDGAAAAFEGVVFNLGELQGEVGCPGASEVEVLLAGLREHGPGFLRRVDGQFALVARCSADGPVLLARDRFGIAPLYWAPTATGVAVGSNLPVVLTLRGDPCSEVGTRFDHDGLVSLLADWAPTDSLTPHAGVHQLRPGHIVTVATDAGTPRVVSDESWGPTPVSAPASSVSASSSEDEIVQLEAAVRESVRVRMDSTGRVACLLSGGIDSTIIGAIARDEGASLGLALALEGDDLVAGRQREVAEALGIDFVQHQLVPREVVDTFEAYVRTRRMPLVRLGPVGMTALARRARAEGISGVLSGEGADELFAGYDSYRILAAREGRFGDPRRLPWAQFGVPEFGAGRGEVWARSYWRGLVSFSASAGSRRLDILRPVADLLRPPLREAVLDAAPSRPDGGPASQADPLEARRQVDLAHLLGGYLLTVQGDHAWMEEGVELRPPYLASPVADWALSRDVREFVRISEGKTPVRALLPRLAQRRPTLTGLGFAKAAFRVDVAFVMREPEQFDRLAGFALDCPDDLVDRAALHTRIDAIRVAGTCSEAESELLTFAASLGVLGQG